jgi:hypothetical protein
MKGKKLDFDRAVLVARENWEVPVRVHLRRFVRFNRRMDRELSKLVARWIHTAAPGASTRRRTMGW